MIGINQPDHSGFVAAANLKQFPNVTSFRDRHNKLRWRYRKDGATVSLGTDYGSAEFISRYAAATNSKPVQPGTFAARIPSRSKSGALSWFIERWYQSAQFEALSNGTQRGYRYIAERLREGHGTICVTALERRHIKAFMAAKADTPSSANNDLRVWRFILDQAREDGLIPTNPAREIKKFATGGEGYHTWTEAEIEAFYRTHAEGTVAHLCMTLMLHTAASRADAVTLGPANVRDGRISYSRQKMKTRDGILVDIPIHPYLKTVLDALPEGQTTFLQTTQGKLRTANGMGTAMRTWCDAAGLPQCSSHGLRKACERRLGEAGMKEQEIAAVLGFVDTTTPHLRLGMGNRRELADKAVSAMSVANCVRYG
jgi:integrase